MIDENAHLLFLVVTDDPDSNLQVIYEKDRDEVVLLFNDGDNGHEMAMDAEWFAREMRDVVRSVRAIRKGLLR